MKILPFEEGLVRRGERGGGKGEVRLPWGLSAPWSGSSCPSRGGPSASPPHLKKPHPAEGGALRGTQL